ncbi:hypothetical protein E3P77_04160, partial [Wallemia ichthyophaga]
MECPICQTQYAAILDHVRKKHGGKLSKSQAASCGLWQCACGMVTSSSSQGMVAHQSRVKCIGWRPSTGSRGASVTRTRSKQLEVDSVIGDAVTGITSHQPPPPPRQSQCTLPVSPTRLNDKGPPPTPQTAPGDLTQEFFNICGACTVIKPLHPAWGAVFRKVVDRLSVAFVNDPSDVNLFHIMCLPKKGLAPCLHQARTGRDKASNILDRYPYTGLNAVPTSKSTNFKSSLHAAEGYVEQGRLGAASNVLGSKAGVLDVTKDVVDTLRTKHPDGEPQPFGNLSGYLPGTMPPEDACLEAMKKMNAGTAPGPSGWTYSLTKEAFKVESFRHFMNLLTRLVVQGVAPGRQMLCASRLIPLGKPDGGVRPIAVGEIFYRLLMKAIMRTYFKPSCLLPFQLGVGSSGGVEPVILAAQRQVDQPNPKFNFVTSLDFSNAFNTVNRPSIARATHKHLNPIFKAVKWAYNQPSSLLMHDGQSPVCIPSSQGVRQGDPMGPLLFSLSIRYTLQLLQKQLAGRATLLAYLDDIVIFSAVNVMDEVDDFFRGTKCGLVLNRNKCEVKKWEDVRSHGTMMLGSMVGPRSARIDFLRAKTHQTLEKLDSLEGIRSQYQLLLLHRCIQTELRHLQRTLRTDDMMEEWETIDQALHDKVRRLRGSPRQRDLDGWIFGMPLRYGGLGLPSHASIAPLAYRSMEEAADRKLQEIFHPDAIVDYDDAPVLQRQRTSAFFEAEFSNTFSTLSREEQNIVLDNQSKLGR